MKTVYTVEEAKRVVERFCVYRERCHQEVQEKLRCMGMIPQAIDVIIAHLIAHDFLNENRFANAFVRGKFKIKKWGRKRLVLELKKRDISTFNIKDALNSITEVEYLSVFYELAEKRAVSLQETNKLKRKKKLADYLLYRGWEPHLVYDKVNELVV